MNRDIISILIAPDSFKENLDTFRVSQAISNGLKKAGNHFDLHLFPMADGGDGSLDVMAHYTGAQKFPVDCMDPLLRKTSAEAGFVAKTGIVEMAKASGLHLLGKEERDPLRTDSYGTGQLVNAVFEKGAKEIILCLGGTATMDGGHGILRAMGFRFLDKAKRVLQSGSESLLELHQIVCPEDMEKWSDIKFYAYVDVENPLTGDHGAARIFSGQKGASPKESMIIERALSHLADVVLEQTGVDIRSIPGGGAAGGVAALMTAFFNVEIRMGAEKIMELSGFKELLPVCDLVITAEGKLDQQTAQGKLPGMVAKEAKAYSKPCIFVGGEVPGTTDSVISGIFHAVYSISPGPSDIQESMRNSFEWLERTAYNLGKLLTLPYHKF